MCRGRLVLSVPGANSAILLAFVEGNGGENNKALD
jgi:hypothetical protein